MNTYTNRDTRRQLLADALATLPPEEQELRQVLEAEERALQGDDWAVTDRTYLAVAADWLWATGPELRALVDDDPVLRALGKPTALSDSQSTAIGNLGAPPGRPSADFLDRVRAAVGQDQNIFMELVHAAHSRWIIQPESERSYPFDDVGVILPLRLETLFDEPNSRFNDNPTQWKLLLRVIPDEASICRDDAHVSADEQKMLAAFWNKIKQPGILDVSWLDGDNAGIAWQQLCDRVTPARAAWLVANFEPRLEGDLLVVDLPPDMPVEPEPNRVGGMPPTLEVWAVTKEVINGETHHHVGHLPMEEGTQIDEKSLTLPLPRNAAEEKTRWWASWDSAKAVGLGGEWLLPEGVTTQTISALYVVGIGDETPDAHFKAQVDAGELGVLHLGTPTNTVNGAATADLGKQAGDWRKVAQMRLQERLHPQEENPDAEVGRTLQKRVIGSTNSLPFFPGADAVDETQESRHMAQALWPALWGHWLHDLWQTGDDAFRVGLWVYFYFCPEGPLMPLRIGDQPYGLLPVTAFSQWQSDASDHAEGIAQFNVEMAMARALNELRGMVASAVQGKRSVVGKSTNQFMDLLGQDAISSSYITHVFTPTWVQLAFYPQLSNGERDIFVTQARAAYGDLSNRFGQQNFMPYLANGYCWRNELSLVEPTRMLFRHQNGEERIHLPLANFLQLWTTFGDPAGGWEGFKLSIEERPEDYDLEAIFRRWWVIENRDNMLSTLPDSLLIRLLVYASQTAFQWIRTPSASEWVRFALQVQQEEATNLAQAIDKPEWRGKEVDPINNLEIYTLHIPNERRMQLERAFRATLDSSANRIDPWITGFAWQRLINHSSSERHNHRLGAYGWVDGPFDGQPGPTPAGRLHTPSYNQTLAALVLRDKFLSSQRAAITNDNGDNPWEMNITAAKARLAEEIADEVRMGFHIIEIVGRYVENILGAHQSVKELRTSDKYAMRPERHDPNEVCNGLRALKGLLKAGDPDATLSDTELQLGAVGPAGDPQFPLSSEQRDQLKFLHLALDTYGDLLMADGVLQLVNRQVERAAETMEAAAGFSKPPSFEFMRTPPSGYQLESVVLSTLPFVSVDGLESDANPIRLADPSVAAFLESKLGVDWSWSALGDIDGALLGTVTLQELGLSPIDTLALSDEFLCDLALRKLGLVQARCAAPRKHQLAQQLVAVLSNRPAAGRDFTSQPDAQKSADTAIYAELSSRYAKLHDACRQMIDDLRNAADDALRITALRRALAWGVTPISEAATRETLLAALTGTELPEDPIPLGEVTKVASEVLEKRFTEAPKPEDLAAIVQISTLAQTIANLASPNSKLAILACWSREAFVDNTKLVTAETEPALDEDWLTVVAASRANLARLEALQLEMDPPLESWSSSPNDPWQSEIVKANLTIRETVSPLKLQMPRFAAAYGTAEAWTGDKVAAGLIDTFSEAIPMPQRGTMAAFGFNAPSARAPQAILLAVPPKQRQHLDSDLLLQIVEETRELAHTRTACMEDLGEIQALAPTMWLQSSGPNRVRLEPWPLFER